MSPALITAAIVFLGSVILSQKLAVNAASRLDDNTKLRIAEVFPKRNVNYTMIVFGLMIAFFIALYVWPQYSLAISLLYAAALVVYLIVKFILNIRKLNEIGAPTGYIRIIKVCFGIFILGTISAVLAAVVVNQVST
jgi:hypothetical protein